MDVGLRGSARRTALAVCLALLAACGPGAAPAPAPAAPAQAPTATISKPALVGKTIVIGMTQYPDTLFDMRSASSGTTQILAAVQPPCVTNLSYQYQPVCFAKLPAFADGSAVTRTVTIDSSYQGSVVINDELVTDASALAQPVDMEQMVVTWTLVDGLKWEDGTPLTANDFVFAAKLRRELDIKERSRFLLARTEKYEAPDANTLVWYGAPGYADATFFLNYVAPEPEHALGAMKPGEIGASDYADKPLAYGPYKIVENIPQERTTLVANQHYWRAGEGLPKVGNVVFKYLTSEDQALQQLRSGEIDVVGPVSLGVGSIPRLDELRRAETINVQYGPTPVWEHLDFAVERGDGFASPFADARVRQAAAYAIDREAIIDSVAYGKSVAMDSFVPRDHWAYPPDGAGLEQYAFDPAKAKALLAEAGWAPGADGILVKDGVPFKVEFFTNEENQARQAVAQIIQEDLKAVGIDMTLSIVQADAVLFATGPGGVLPRRRFDLALYAWVSDGEPPVELYRCDQIPTPANNYAGQNNTGWCSPAYDQAALASQAETDPAKRLALQIEAQKIWNAQLPSLPLYQRLNVGAARAPVTGLRLDPTSTVDFWNIETWDIDE